MLIDTMQAEIDALRSALAKLVEVVEYVGDADACALGWSIPGARLAFVRPVTEPGA